MGFSLKALFCEPTIIISHERVNFLNIFIEKYNYNSEVIFLTNILYFLLN